MKNQFSNYVVKYEFRLSVWTNESVIVSSNNEDNAKIRAYEYISGVYGTEICEDLKIISASKTKRTIL